MPLEGPGATLATRDVGPPVRIETRETARVRGRVGPAFTGCPPDLGRRRLATRIGNTSGNVRVASGFDGPEALVPLSHRCREENGMAIGDWRTRAVGGVEGRDALPGRGARIDELAAGLVLSSVAP